MEAELQKVVDEIEAEKALGKVSGVNVFRSLLNQPDLLALSSADANTQGTTTGFSSVQITLPRPMLEVDTIQLVHANIPQCVQNIPDTACGFWYYRMNAYTGQLPCLNNLHFVRLLPSYYKQEFIPSSSLYGYNQTFHSYQDLAQQLDLATKNDLGNTNWNNLIFQAGEEETTLFDSRFLPYDTEITYNETLNKFQFQGMNPFRNPAYLEWNDTISYEPQDRIVYPVEEFDYSWTCLIANTNEEPSFTSPFWVADNDPVVDVWSSTLTYQVNRIVSYNQTLYIAKTTTTNNIPDASPTQWGLIPEGFVWNRYLITGYDDPNVQRIQNSLYAPWESNFLFEEDEPVEYNGVFYNSTKQNFNAIPTTNPTIWTPVSTPITKAVSVETLITIDCDPTLFATTAPGTIVYVVDTTNPLFNLYTTDGFLSYANVYEFVQALPGGIELENTLNFTPQTPSQTTTGGLVCLRVPPNLGLSRFSGQFDFVFNGVGNIPPQPYNPTPKRLLNSILGFTWNGIFTNSEFGQNYSQNTQITSRVRDVTFLNRLRPVPDYLLVPIIPPLLGATPITPAQNSGLYTADGYANLVYSSILSIYASIVAGSTINTNQNTGLLALTSMNAGNLGVSFYSQPINQPLSINGADIYTLALYFEDEFGEPYFFTNNAVLSFMLKITYKNKVVLK